MSALSNLKSYLAEHNDKRQVPLSPVPVLIAGRDDAVEDDGFGPAEGQSFVIEYTDSRGDRSVRRVSVYGVKAGAGNVPMLVCKCHERQATRTFRADRISRCFDYDGVVYDDVPAFLQETLGLSPQAASRSYTDDEKEVWKQTRLMLRPQVIFLTSLAHVDGSFHQFEMEVIVEHCSRAAHRRNLGLTETTHHNLVRYVTRSYPTAELVDWCIDEVRQLEGDDVVCLLRAGVNVIDADGRRLGAEAALLNDFALETIGTPIL